MILMISKYRSNIFKFINIIPLFVNRLSLYSSAHIDSNSATESAEAAIVNHCFNIFSSFWFETNSCNAESTLPSDNKYLWEFYLVLVIHNKFIIYIPVKFISKLNFSNYILCLAEFYITIFCIIILDILCILHRFMTFCKHFATAITSNHSLGISLCTPDTHPLKYGTHSYCRLKSACVLL